MYIFMVTSIRQQVTNTHRQRSNKILNSSNRYQGESDCDTVASDLSVDPPTYHPKKSRTRRYSDVEVMGYHITEQVVSMGGMYQLR